MVSEQKLAANRRNAQKSTGPRTPSGKAIASMNAVKHGLTATKPLITGESEADFAGFVDRWLDEIRPTGARQELLAEQIILAAWQMRRVAGLRAGVIGPQIDRNIKYELHPTRMEAEAYAELGKLDRHQAALERTYQRSFKELEQLQAEGAEVEEELQNEPTTEARDQRLEAQGLHDEPTTEARDQRLEAQGMQNEPTAEARRRLRA